MLYWFLFISKKEIENNEELENLTKDRDQIVLELESTRNQLEKSKETIVQLTNTRQSYEGQLASLNQEIEKSENRVSKHSRVEEVLQRQISELQAKVESAKQGEFKGIFYVLWPIQFLACQKISYRHPTFANFCFDVLFLNIDGFK